MNIFEPRNWPSARISSLGTSAAEEDAGATAASERFAYGAGVTRAPRDSANGNATQRRLPRVTGGGGGGGEETRNLSCRRARNATGARRDEKIIRKKKKKRQEERGEMCSRCAGRKQTNKQTKSYIIPD